MIRKSIMNMSIEKVIEILDSGKAPETEQDFGDFDTAMETAINLLKTHPDNQLNDPLTLEELREMDGKPVYDRMGYGWFIVCEVTDDEVIMTDGTVFDIDEDSPNTVGQRFYRRKPEEGAP